MVPQYAHVIWIFRQKVAHAQQYWDERTTEGPLDC